MPDVLGQEIKEFIKDLKRITLRADADEQLKKSSRELIKELKFLLKQDDQTVIKVIGAVLSDLGNTGKL